MFDETFKFLDAKNMEIAIEQLRDLNCRSIFIVSHLDSFPFFDQIILVEIDDKVVFLGFVEEKMMHLGFDQPAVMEYHTLHVLRVKK